MEPEESRETVRPVIGIRVNEGALVARCDPGEMDLRVGDTVVLQNDQGQWLGRVISRLGLRDEPGGDGRGDGEEFDIVRPATSDDLTKFESSARLEKEAFSYCSERIEARKLAMDLSKVERCLDGSKMTFYFTAEGRIDFRALVKDLAGRFRCRVEMRQVGVRNETKILGGVGGCGRELCCCTFMNDFTPVSVKMAKEQNLSLNPNKISGLCGRLMCCLAYEFPTYMAAKKNMSKVGRRVNCPEGLGKVVRQNVMAGKVTVNVEGREYEYDAGEVNPAPPPQQPKKQKPPRAPVKGKRSQ